MDDSATAFITRWYGAVAGDGGIATASAGAIPDEITAWHRAAASTGVRVTFQDYPVALPELARAGDGMMVFWVENQGAYWWAVDPDDESRMVFSQELGSDAWQATGETLDEFLLHVTISEAIVGAQAKLTALVPVPVLGDRALAGFVPLDFHALANEDPATRIYRSHDALARVTSPPAGYARPHQPSLMLTIAVADGRDIGEYGPRLEGYLLTGASRTRPAEFSAEDLPF